MVVWTSVCLWYCTCDNPVLVNWPIRSITRDINTIHWRYIITMTLKMTTAQVVETSVTVTNSSFQNYTHPDDHTTRTTDTPGFKPFTNILTGKKTLFPYPFVPSHSLSPCSLLPLSHFTPLHCVLQCTSTSNSSYSILVFPLLNHSTNLLSTPWFEPIHVLFGFWVLFSTNCAK